MNLIATTSFLVCLFTVQASFAQQDIPTDKRAVEPGFSEAYFDTSTVQELLKSKKATGIRFYNAQADPRVRTGTAMAIGIRSDGSEINWLKTYQLNLGLVDGKIAMSKLNSKNARTACENLDDAKHPSYSASFIRSEIQELLDLPGCQALEALPDTTDKGESSMRLRAVKLIDGKVEPLGNGERFERLCAFPCPLLCGPESNYVYRSKFR